MANHISQTRKDATREKIKAKIKVLEGYAAHGVPTGAFIPPNMASFRRWEDKAIGLEQLGSPSTLDKPHNRGLKRRTLELLKLIANKEDKKVRRIHIIDTQRIQIKNLSRLTQELTSQLHATRHALDQSRLNETRWRSRVDELTNEIGELHRTISNVTGLRVIRSSSEEIHHDVKQ